MDSLIDPSAAADVHSTERAERERRRFGPGIYVHVPFCGRLCSYCDFYVVIGLGERKERFLRALAREIECWSADPRHQGQQFRTLYFGGGTPSLLAAEELCDLVGRFRRAFDLALDAEVTVECNPESLDAPKLRAYADAGVNRISLGVQSMDAHALELLTREHDAARVVETVAEIRAAGFTNLGLDVIYGLPGQDPGALAATVESLLAFEPEHLSAYALSLEPKAALRRRIARESIPTAADDEVREQFDWLRGRFRDAGYRHYEISNFALAGHESRHNQIYWSRGDCLAFGPSAHGHWDGLRWANVRSLHRYSEFLEAGLLPVEIGSAAPEGAAVLEEWILLGLRRLEGIDWRIVVEATPERSLEPLERTRRRLEGEGWLMTEGNNVRLSEAALFISNSVLVELLRAF